MSLDSKRIKEIFVKNYPIILILLVAFSVRFYGIYFDYPGGVVFIWDETFHITQLFDRIEQRAWFVDGSGYPFLLSFIYIPLIILRLSYIALVNGIFTIEGLKEQLVAGGMGQLFIIVRWYSVFFGTATVFFFCGTLVNNRS